MIIDFLNKASRSDSGINVQKACTIHDPAKWKHLVDESAILDYRVPTSSLQQTGIPGKFCFSECALRLEGTWKANEEQLSFMPILFVMNDVPGPGPCTCPPDTFYALVKTWDDTIVMVGFKSSLFPEECMRASCIMGGYSCITLKGKHSEEFKGVVLLESLGLGCFGLDINALECLGLVEYHEAAAAVFAKDVEMVEEEEEEDMMNTENTQESIPTTIVQTTEEDISTETQSILRVDGETLHVDTVQEVEVDVDIEVQAVQVDVDVQAVRVEVDVDMDMETNANVNAEVDVDVDTETNANVNAEEDGIVGNLKNLVLENFVIKENSEMHFKPLMSDKNPKDVRLNRDESQNRSFTHTHITFTMPHIDVVFVNKNEGKGGGVDETTTTTSIVTNTISMPLLLNKDKEQLNFTLSIPEDNAQSFLGKCILLVKIFPDDNEWEGKETVNFLFVFAREDYNPKFGPYDKMFNHNFMKKPRMLHGKLNLPYHFFLISFLFDNPTKSFLIRYDHVDSRFLFHYYHQSIKQQQDDDDDDDDEYTRSVRQKRIK